MSIVHSWKKTYEIAQTEFGVTIWYRQFARRLFILQRALKTISAIAQLVSLQTEAKNQHSQLGI